MAKSDRKKGEAQSSPSSFAPVLPIGAIFLGGVAAGKLTERGDRKPSEALSDACKMRRSGKTRAEIHDATSAALKGTPYAGVSYPKDGKPRFELSDHDAS